MKQSNNIILAVAGSGKTTKIVNDVLSLQGKKCLIVTYTINNIEEIKRKFFNKKGVIPENVTIMPWFTFLLRNFVRPYQNILYEGGRICGICRSLAGLQNSPKRMILKDITYLRIMIFIQIRFLNLVVAAMNSQTA